MVVSFRQAAGSKDWMLSYVPQLWHCSSGRRLENITVCSWRGYYPVENPYYGIMEDALEVAVAGFEEELFLEEEYQYSHPTCPRCGGHRFKVQDLPIPNSPEWEALQ